MKRLRNTFGKFGAKIMPQRAQRKALNVAIGMLQEYPETRLLLELAQSKNIGVLVDKSLPRTAAGMLRSDRETGQEYIALAPFNDPTDLALTLIHELRHVWQDEMLGLNPKNRAISEPDSETHLILRRVKEADAHAFVNLMSSRMRHMKEDMMMANDMAEKLTQDLGKPLTDAQQKTIAKYIGARVETRQREEEKQMIRDFNWALENIDNYDREAMIEYHLRYTSPQYPSAAHPETSSKFGLSDIRKMLKLGVSPHAPGYLDHIADDHFRAAVLQDVDPSIKKVSKIMVAFEKISKKPMKEYESQFHRYEIEKRLADAVQRPPKPRPPAQYG